MMPKVLRLFVLVYFSAAAMSALSCDFAYKILQKEGAEEKDLLGEILPFTYNANVEEVQQLLKIHGYNPGKADGKIGNNTRKAIEKFQQDHGLKITRFVDKKTWAKLSLVKEAGLVLSGEINMKTLQTVLKSAGFNPGKIDGKGGRQTQKALQDFQAAHGLKPDGVIGSQTLNKLVEYLSSPAQ